MEALLPHGGAIVGAQWVLGKALSPLSDGLVEAWAATTELEPNIEALKTELLYAQAMLENARGTEIRSHALGELLQKLRRLAYGAEDVLDELDYFRIQDRLEDSFEAVDDPGCGRNLVRDARHAASAAAKKLSCSSCMSPARGSDGRADEESCKCVRLLASRARTGAKKLCCASCLSTACISGEDSDEDSGEDSRKCVRRLVSSARTTARAFGKRLLCPSLSAREGDQGDDSKHAPGLPKLKFDRVGVSTRMRCIADELKPLCAKVSTILGLQLSGSVIAELRLGSSRSIGSSASTSRPITTSQTLEHRVYGRDLQKKTIVEHITNGTYIERALTVIPIVGSGGIGKTTLAQYIYNSETVRNHFQVRVWVCVSLDFSVHKLTREIVSSIPKAEDEKNDLAHNDIQNLDQLQKLIEKRLKNRRFLLVLDDIWKYGNEDEWKRFLVPFKKEPGNGDVVLVTTRLLEVAEMVKQGDKLLQLEGLEPTEYWSLFQSFVFDETNQQDNSEDLTEIGEKIVEKLKGSPLAAKTVGRLLRQNLSVDHWARVLESKEWESESSAHDIMPALKLSYDYLPFHLQQCFSSCALFPEDYEFDSEELIHFWIGLDILHPGHRNKRIEDIGRNNIDDLVNYGFLKKETRYPDTYHSGTYHPNTYYVMHDLLHDLALKVSSQEYLHIASSSPRDVEMVPSIYHLCISMSDLANREDGPVQEKIMKELDKMRNIIKFENLRTLMLFGNYDGSFFRIFSDLFENAKSLRVLYLSTMWYPVEYLLCNFSKLVHLRYLRLVSSFVNAEHLPRSISRFYQLRVLDIRRWNGDQSPLGDMSNLVKLLHFLVPDDYLHSKISDVGKLHSLRELRRFEVRKESSGFELGELGKLEEIGGSLEICNLEKAVLNEAHEAKLLYKNRLQKLTLGWEKGRSINPIAEDQLLESLRPHSNLHELFIDGHGGSTCPTWLGANLTTKGLEALRLDNTGWEFLPPLGELYLINESGGEYFGCIREPELPDFHNLKRLELIGLPRFRRWVVANKGCPKYLSLIEVLVVEGCPELTELPFTSYPPGRDLNVTRFPRLAVIYIRNCQKLLSVPPMPYSHTLRSVALEDVGRGVVRLFLKDHYLNIKGNDALPSLDENFLAFDNLTQLKTLIVGNCPPLAEKHLIMLTSLKTLEIWGSTIVFPPLAISDVKWQLPILHLKIESCRYSGKELTRLLSHLPELSSLWIRRPYVAAAASLSLPAVKLQDTHGSSSAVKLQDTRGGTDQHQEVEHEVEEEEIVMEPEDDDDALLLLPAHLSDSLQELHILGFPEPILTAQNLEAMHSLKEIRIEDCPRFLSAYKAADLSSCCPFPSSLQDLSLCGRMEGMDTLAPLSNLTSLEKLRLLNLGEDLRCEGLLPLLAQGQLTTLEVYGSPKFWDHAQEQPSSKLQELQTDVIITPTCSFLSSSLTNLTLESVNEVERFTNENEEALLLLTSLQELRFECCHTLRHLPAGLHKLTSLERLEIRFLQEIRSLRKTGLPSSLRDLVVQACTNLRCLPEGLHKLTNLKRLEIFFCPLIQSLPKNGLPSSLQVLDVNNCHKLRGLPAGLNKLTNLERLRISSCPLIQSLPKNGLPSSLQELDVYFCDNKELKQQCRRLLRIIPTVNL